MQEEEDKDENEKIVEQRKKDIAFIPAETVFQAIAAIFPDMGSPTKLCEKFVELTENKVIGVYTSVAGSGFGSVRIRNFYLPGSGSDRDPK